MKKWFDDYSRTAPTNTNRALKLSRQIMNFAIARGYVQANPMRGIARNRRPSLTRFLSPEQIARLHRALDGQTRESNRQQADIIRLLLLTGCRRGEIFVLRWSEFQGDMLVTGVRAGSTVADAQAILAGEDDGKEALQARRPRLVAEAELYARSFQLAHKATHGTAV